MTIEYHIEELSNLFVPNQYNNQQQKNVCHDAFVFIKKQCAKKSTKNKNKEQELILLMIIVFIQQKNTDNLIELCHIVDGKYDGAILYHDACLKLYDNDMESLLIDISTDLSHGGIYYIITLYYSLLSQLHHINNQDIGHQIFDMALAIRILMQKIDLPKSFGDHTMLRAMMLQLLMVLSKDEMRHYLQDKNIRNTFTDMEILDYDILHDSIPQHTQPIIITAVQYDMIDTIIEKFLPSLNMLCGQDSTHPNQLIIAITYDDVEKIKAHDLDALYHQCHQHYTHLNIHLMPLKTIILQESTYQAARFFAAQQIINSGVQNDLMLIDGTATLNQPLTTLCHINDDAHLGLFIHSHPPGLCYYYQADFIFVKNHIVNKDFLWTVNKFIDFFATNADADTKMVHRAAIWSVIAYLTPLGTAPQIYDYGQ